VKQRDKILIAVAASLVAVMAGWFIIAKPKRAEMRTLDTQIEAKRTELSGVSARAAQYRAARDSLVRNPQAFRQSAKALPNRVAMSELLRTLSRTASGTGVTMSDLSTSAGDASTPGISSVNLALTFDGTFLELQRFLGKLQKFVKVSKQRVAAKGRLLALDGISLTAGEGSTSVSAKVSATAYILQPGALSVGAGATAPPSGAAPATTPAPAAATPTTTGAATP
jgi:Tfp pilus assembly protein PilO